MGNVWLFNDKGLNMNKPQDAETYKEVKISIVAIMASRKTIIGST